MASSPGMSGPAPAAAQLLGSLSAHPEKTALELAGRTVTYGDLDRLSARFAAGLAARGINAGDAVALRMESSPEMVAAVLGTFRAGATCVPVNPALTAEETRHILTDSGAALTIGRAGARPDEACLAFEETLSGAMKATRPRDGSGAETIALLLYTSGTTGRSKGVEHSFLSVVSNLSAVMDLWRVTDGDKVVIALPLFHVHGLGLGVIGPLLRGATVLLHERFDPARIVSAFERGGATLFMGVPTMYVRLLEHLKQSPRAADALAKARLFTAGSAALSADDFAAFRSATGQAVLERYGMTETFFTLSNPYDGKRRAGTVGLPVPGCEIRILGDDGRDVAAGEQGELLVRSNGMMSRYRNLPGETAASFRDGWFLTGDVAAMSADGYVTLYGRKALDFVKSGGYRISTREIEEILSRHPRVREAAVVGLPDRVWGERVVAAVTLREEPTLPAAPGRRHENLEEELAVLAKAALAPYKHPRAIFILDQLPRNSLGKVLKPRLAERLAERAKEGG